MLDKQANKNAATETVLLNRMVNALDGPIIWLGAVVVPVCLPRTHNILGSGIVITERIKQAQLVGTEINEERVPMIAVDQKRTDAKAQFGEIFERLGVEQAAILVSNETGHLAG